MIEKKDEMEQFINSELQKEADRIEREVGGESGGEVSQNHISSVKSKLDEQIHDIEVEKIIAQLPKDEQDAYKLGKEMQREGRQEEQANEKEKKAASKRKKRKIYAGAAAAAMVFMAVGITSFGGAKKVVELLKQTVGQREVTKVNSNKAKAKTLTEKEEEAYQEISEEFGINPVRLTIIPEGMTFDEIQLEKGIQTAELFYSYKGKTISYYISLSYNDASWGFDIEDKITDQWNKKRKECLVEITEYITPKTKMKRYSAQFEYEGVEYLLNAEVSKEEFEIIIENLHFL